MDREFEKLISTVRFYVDLEKEAGMEEYYFLRRPNKEGSPSGGGASDLETLRKEAADCTNCDLYKTRRNCVFGSGNPKAALMFIGEAPGEDEDIQGQPFVGRAGQLLTKIIEAMGLKRNDVYIANILKCRPPGNRAPLPTEVLACEENVKRQIELIRPKVICTLGKIATQTLLRTQDPISSLRGRLQDYNGIKVMPTFHPAYLLRNPQDKRLVWEDMKKVVRQLRCSRK